MLFLFVEYKDYGLWLITCDGNSYLSRIA